MLKARLESDEELTKSGGAGGRTNATLNIDRYLDELGKSIEHEKPIEPRTNRYSTNRFHRLSSDTSDSLLTSGLESDHKSTRMLGGKRQQDLHGRTSTPIPMDNATLAQFSSSASQVSSVHSLAVSNGTLADSQTALYQSSHHDHGTSSSAGSTVSIGHHRTGNLLPPNLRTLPPPSSAMQTMSAPTNVFPVSSRPKKRLDDVEVGIDMHSDATSTIHFATPFEFSNKMPRKSLDRKSHPTIRLVWRNVTYRASGSRKTNNSASTVSSSGASSSTIPSGSSMSDHRPYHHQRSKSSGNSSDSSLAGKRKLILDRQSGEIHGGQLTAIIGPSGAGKSTLLECLAGRRSLRLSGHVYLEYPPEYVAAGQRVRISFIAQKDTVIAMLTVRETLLFASKLKNYRLIKNAHYHMRLVNALLHELQLDKCAEIAACRISGGQLKRLSFALELISGPDILLLDEPTSGLDSSSAGSTITLLRRLTDLRRSAPTASAWRYKPPAILCSIHQPSASVLQLFHRIYVLSNDGRCVYNGSPFNLLPHLARFDLHCPQFHNPADFIVEVASGDYGSAAINQLAKHCRLASERYNDEHDGDNDDDDEDDDGHDDIESGSVDSTVFDSKPYEQDKRKGRIHDSDAAVEDHHRAYNYQDSYRKYGQPEYISEDGGPGNRRDAKSNGHRHATAGQRKRTRNSNSRSYAPSAAIASGRMKRVKVTKVLQRMRQQRYPLWTHFWLLLRRTYLTTSRDPKLTWFRILQALFIGGVMAFLYDYPIGESDACILDTRNASSVEDDFGNTLNSRTQDNIAFIFFITLFTVMASMMPTVLTFPAEVTVLIQERNNGWYSCWTYYWTKIIADTPYQLVITITFCSIVYPATGQPWIWWRFALFNLISVLVAMIAQSVGILFGTIYVHSVETAVFMAPLSMAPVFLLSGFFAKVSKLPWFLKPIAIVSYVRYAFEAFLVAIYGLNRCEDVPLYLDVSENAANSLAGEDTDTNNEPHAAPYSSDQASFQSRAHELFERVPTYAAEFPKVWSGFYNPVAYVQQMETSNSNGAGGLVNDVTSGDVAYGYLNDAINNNHTASPHSSSLLEANKAFPTGSFVLNHFELNDTILWENLIILVGILLFLRIVGYILLILKTNQKR